MTKEEKSYYNGSLGTHDPKLEGGEVYAWWPSANTNSQSNVNSCQCTNRLVCKSPALPASSARRLLLPTVSPFRYIYLTR